MPHTHSPSVSLPLSLPAVEEAVEVAGRGITLLFHGVTSSTLIKMLELELMYPTLPPSSVLPSVKLTRTIEYFLHKLLVNVGAYV